MLVQRRQLLTVTLICVVIVTKLCTATTTTDNTKKSSVCPNGIQQWCNCELYSVGYSIKCRNISLQLPELIERVNSLRIMKLAVSQVTWTEIKRLPKASIQCLSLNDCNIRTVEPNALENIAENLQEINLSHNRIMEMPRLGKLPKLASLELNHNELPDIPENCFTGTTSLRSLKIKANRICTLSRMALNETKEKLELLDLSDNCFERIPAQNLRNSLNLQQLDLSGNRISEIANFELMNLPQLLELDIRGNRLERIAHMAFMNVPNLQYLYLSNNSISNIESPRLFQVFKQLQILDLSKNQLTKIPIIKELPNIREIRGDWNKIERIDTLTFSANPKLHLISLQNNNISSLAKNSFDALEQLSVLLLNNNSLTVIERGMLDGIRNLQELNLNNNSLKHIGDKSFASVTGLIALHLSNNQLTNLSDTVFDPLKRLHWLDLSYNNISSFKPGTFKHRIAQLIFHGNKLICDDNINWLVDYLVLNNVRIFLPFQPEIVCLNSGEKSSSRLKELLIKKANETVNIQNERSQSIQDQNFLYSLIPNNMINGFAKNSLPLGTNRNFPPNNGQQSQSLLNAHGTETQLSDINAVLKTMPDTTVSIPGIGTVDISKLPPNVISHVLRGGQIPGIPKETLDQLIRVYARKLQIASSAQTATGNIVSTESMQTVDEHLIKRPLNEQQTSIINLTNNKSATNNVITIIRPKIVDDDNKTYSSNDLSSIIQLPPQLVQLLKLLPPNYDLARIPNEVMQAVSRNELPDFGLLPADLQQHLITNIHNVVNAFVDQQNITIDDIIKKLPKIERPIAPTFPPYNIDEVRNDLIHMEHKMQQQRRIQLYTASLLSFVGIISTIVVVMLCIYMKRKRRAEMENGMEEDSLVNTAQYPTKLMIPTPPTTELPSYSAFNSQYSTVHNYGRQPRPLS